MRVIAGSLRGRRLCAPPGARTRPSSDRVREALFSALGPLDGLSVLDLYAGSGALAIEALSRGARAAVAVERGRPALAALRRNLGDLGLSGRCVVLPLPVERAVDALARLGPFDLVLADPPYALMAGDREGSRALTALMEQAGVVRPGARLVIEHAWRDGSPALSVARCERARRYGETALSFYQLAVPVAPRTDQGR
jgi:16S rRNA (guanine966-N2)-methyltransferase